MLLRVDLLISIILLSLNLSVTLENDDLIVQLPYGKLRGRDMGFYYSYESVPYAEPPVGALRFEAPQAYKQIWQDVFDTAQKSMPLMPCIQWSEAIDGPNKLTGVEDCLHVHIYKPKIENRTNFLVLVQIHGGGFMHGTGMYNNHEKLMRSGNFIIVKINYRVGVMGFISAEDENLPGNYGLKDQHLALRWVKENIASFGGDPEQILVLGFSAGGASIHLHILKNDLHHVAKAAVSLSGTALNPWVIQRKPRKHAFALAKIVKCYHGNDTLAMKNCLKMKSADEVVSATGELLIFGHLPFALFGPVIEPAGRNIDAFITQDPLDIMKSSNYTQIPWLVSYSAQDGGYNAVLLLKRDEQQQLPLMTELNARWKDLLPTMLFYEDTYDTREAMDSHSVALKNRYLEEQPFDLETYPLIQKMFTDVLFKNGVEQTIYLHSKYGKSPIYAYVYDNPPNRGLGQFYAKRNDINFGTVHGDDFFLILHSRIRGDYYREDEKRISANLIEMLENFAQSETGELKFGNCTFVNNINKEHLQLMSITRSGCRNKEYDPKFLF